jgi:hypothetical protein
MGRWNIDVQHSNYVTDIPVSGSLAAAGHVHNGRCRMSWPKGCHTSSTRERYLYDIPSVLIDKVFPFLPQLREAVAEASRRPKVVGPGNVLQHLTELGRALVQDSIYKQITNPSSTCVVLQYLRKIPDFIWQVTLVTQYRAAGIYEQQRPKCMSTEVATSVANLLRQGQGLAPVSLPHAPLPLLPAPLSLPPPFPTGHEAGSQLPPGFPVGPDYFTSARSLMDVSVKVSCCPTFS